jgi:hypothetical protein
MISATFRWVTWITIGFIVASTFALTLAPIFGCNPISAYWDQVNIKKTLQGYEYHCLDEGADIFAASVISVAQDLITVILPTFLYWNLQIPCRQKIRLFGIFSIGYGGVALGSIRAYYSWQTYYSTYDVTWSTWKVLLTSMLELHIGAFCANAPAVTVFFKHFFHCRLAPQGTQSKTPKNTGQKYNNGKHFYSSTSTFLDKVVFFLSRHGSWSSRNGYVSESNAGVSVYSHGGVQVKKEIQITPDPDPALSHTTNCDINEYANTTNVLYGHCYDVELTEYTTGKSSQASSLRLLKINGGDESEIFSPTITPCVLTGS